MKSEAVSEREAYAIGVEAYLFFYPLVTMDLTRRQLTNVPAGKVSTRPVAFWDVLPTACDLLKQPRPKETDGISLLIEFTSPLMVAVFVDGLRSVPRGWLEGALGLGINRWRTFWKIGVRTARPALVAGAVLATAREERIGEMNACLSYRGPDAKDVFVDEAQDLNEIQYRIFCGMRDKLNIIINMNINL